MSFTNAEESMYAFTRVHRSSARISPSTLPNDCVPRGRFGGRGIESTVRDALRTYPADWSASIRDPLEIGTRRATGRPRSVISIDSPASTLETTADAFCWRARIPTDGVMCVNVAHAGVRSRRPGSLLAASWWWWCAESPGKRLRVKHRGHRASAAATLVSWLI